MLKNPTCSLPLSSCPSVLPQPHETGAHVSLLPRTTGQRLGPAPGLGSSLPQSSYIREGGGPLFKPLLMAQALHPTSLSRQTQDRGYQDVLFWGTLLGKTLCFFHFLFILFFAVISVEAHERMEGLLWSKGD